jgi:hypothetical protein
MFRLYYAIQIRDITQVTCNLYFFARRFVCWSNKDVLCKNTVHEELEYKKNARKQSKRISEGRLK